MTLNVELVKFEEVGNIEIAGKVFPAKMRRGHSVLETFTYDGEGVFYVPKENSTPEKVTAEDIIKAGLTPRLVLWEGGGNHTNIGSARIICGLKGEKLAPVYIRRRGSLACSAFHAKFIAWPGQKLIQVDAEHHRGDFSITIDEIYLDKSFLGKTKRLWQGQEIDKSNIEEYLPSKLDRYLDAVKAAMNKATCYHCREPHYILDEES